VTAVECVDLASSRRFSVRGDAVVLAAGALATPQLLLTSGLHRSNPGGDVVGRYLMRHCNAVVCGFFLAPPGEGPMSFKEIAVHDFYFGHPRHPDLGRVGSIQQVGLPEPLVRAQAPRLLRALACAALPHLMGVMVMAEDQPVRENGVSLDPRRRDAAGLPGLSVRHRYSARDRHARRILVTEAKRLLRSAGALICVTHPIDTFSHALGTVRMGRDQATSALDARGWFRGIANLYVADASALPTSAAVNPSLTIAAHALRVADCIARVTRTRRASARTNAREILHVSQ
jgi:choline dehydrogenase-like flavoprotein